MAYLRYSKTCEWYICERDDSRLAVWHKDSRSSDASFDRVEVESMLSADSFLVVPGDRLDQKNILREAFQAWLRSIVARTASKRLRRQRLLVRLGIRRNEPIDPDTVVSPDAPADVASEVRIVYGLLDRLPAEERVALVLRRVEGLDLGEVAEQMNLSLATVKRRISAAEGRLARARARK